MIPHVRAEKMYVTIANPTLDHVDICSKLIEGKCPLTKGATVVAQIWLDTDGLNIPWKYMPLNSLDCNMEFSITNEKDQSLGCFTGPISIFKP